MGQKVIEMMEEYGLSALSGVVIEDYKIKDQFHYGQVSLSDQTAITEATKFQVASLSKSITATAVMRLVESKIVDLDIDVNVYLSDYPLDQPVTLRQLLSHTAGVNVEGFNGYLRNEYIPNLSEIIQGEGNSSKIKLVSTPGLTFHYSGGGYILIQKILTEVTHQSFPDLIQSLVFDPLSMTESTFDSNMTGVVGYYSKGNNVQLNYQVYPESAAAGLVTTPRDFAKWVIELQKCLIGKSSYLSQTTVEMMLTPVANAMRQVKMCLGIFQATPMVYFHQGGNAGFTSRYVMTKEGSGIVLVGNCSAGSLVMDYLVDEFAKQRNLIK